MANRRIEKYLDVKGSDTTKVKVEVYYSLGGMSFYDYKQRPRGYYISATKVEVENHGSYKSESYDLFGGGIADFISEANRFNEKKLQAAVEQSTEKEKRLVEYICNKFGLELVQPLQDTKSAV